MIISQLKLERSLEKYKNLFFTSALNYKANMFMSDFDLNLCKASLLVPSDKAYLLLISSSTS